MKAAPLTSLVLWATMTASGAYDHELPPTCDPAIYAQIIPSLELVKIPDHESADSEPRELLEYWWAVKRQARPSPDTGLFVKFNPSSQSTISFIAKDDSFLSAIDKLCGAADLTWQMTPGGMAIRPVEPPTTE